MSIQTELNARGEQCLADELAPYKQMDAILGKLRDDMSTFIKKYAVNGELQSENLTVAYNKLAEGSNAAEDMMFGVTEELEESLTEQLLAEPSYCETYCDDDDRRTT